MNVMSTSGVLSAKTLTKRLSEPRLLIDAAILKGSFTYCRYKYEVQPPALGQRVRRMHGTPD